MFFSELFFTNCKYYYYCEATCIYPIKCLSFLSKPNGNPAYKTLMHRLDEMNDYRNRLRAEIGRLTNVTLNNPSLSNEE